MCQLSDHYFICERCHALTTGRPQARYQCHSGSKKAAFGHTCPYFYHEVYLDLIAPTCTETPCYWCHVGKRPPIDALLSDYRVLRQYIRRSVYTDYGFDGRGSNRNPDNIYGQVYFSISRRT